MEDHSTCTWTAPRDMHTSLLLHDHQTTRQSLESTTFPKTSQTAKQPGRDYVRKMMPRKRKRTAGDWGTTIYNRRLLLDDNAASKVAGKHQPLPEGQASQRQDTPRTSGQAKERKQKSPAKDSLLDKKPSLEAPPVPMVARSNALANMPPKVEAAVTRQYKLVASEMTPLFSPRLPSVPDARPLSVSQAKPTDLAQYSDVLAVIAADIGPAESSQRSFTEDPVLMRAKYLAGPSLSTSPLKLEMSSQPRFRLVPSWGPTPGKTMKGPQLPREPRETPKSLESQISELQMKDETKEQITRPRPISDVSPSRPESIGSEQSEPASGAESKATEDLSRGDTQDPLTLRDKSSVADDEGGKVVEPVPSPAPDSRTIFEKLFGDQERTRGPDHAQLSSRLKATMAARREKRVDAERQNVLETVPQDEDNARRQADLNVRHGLSIFRQLFPEQAGPETTQSEPEISRDTYGILHPPEDSVMVSLRNEVRNWVDEGDQAQISWPKPGDYGSHSTVVVISGTSPSLMDTDFYRIAPEGKHVEGWAGGLAKVIQAHDSISYDPLGQYYLMFYSQPSALAYVSEVRRLHELSRRLLHAPGDSGREVAKGSLDQAPALPQPFLTDEERAAVRSFTLFPPHIRPHISVRLWNTQLVEELAAKSNIADVLPTLRPEASTPARVLLKLTSPDGQHGEGQGGLTTDELWLTLRDDGRERSAPWVLANLSEGIMPVRPRFMSERYKITVKAEPVPVPLELGDGEDDYVGDASHGAAGGPVVGPSPPPRKGADGSPAVDRNERFRRFVLTFTQPAIARRFVRCWHKRVVYDALLNRSVVIDAAAIM
ncbi:hypothetical protein KVR01_002730 [Diaporthe batatas]|uniref:uncharacterized protein n=1 Tax=Diaporthe batatas TaxID=748121 RepID=UPI001D037C87|nr:uncharacterized protein KVR01_002730 [Diaporthe batatas]KAG8167041.1 hypothetical protein KVR01_002730 [Diaporthe batatas]